MSGFWHFGSLFSLKKSISESWIGRNYFFWSLLWYDCWQLRMFVPYFVHPCKLMVWSCSWPADTVQLAAGMLCVWSSALEMSHHLSPCMFPQSLPLLGALLGHPVFESFHKLFSLVLEESEFHFDTRLSLPAGWQCYLVQIVESSFEATLIATLPNSFLNGLCSCCSWARRKP